MTTRAPFGTWASPITASLLVERAVSLSFPVVEDDTLYWLEGRPSEQGRSVIVKRGADGAHEDVIAPSSSARTLVHEYGGRPYAVRGETVYFSEFSTQQLFRLEPGSDAVAITPPPPQGTSDRFAAPVVTPDGRYLICVHEHHENGNVDNDIVAVTTDGSMTIKTLASGHDFYGPPTVSPDGRTVAFCCWDHPNMPWDGTTLYVIDVDADMLVTASHLVAGGRAESITQPRFAPDGALFYVSDRSDYWNLYVDDGEGGQPFAPASAEFAGPDWVLGSSSYAFTEDGSIVATWTTDGVDHVGVRPLGDDTFRELTGAFTALGDVQILGSRAVVVAGSSIAAAALVETDLADGATSVVRQSRELALDPSVISPAESITFPTENGKEAYALYFAPKNDAFEGEDGERPPLVVMSHGGPTARSSASLRLEIQYFTSRGIAVVDVNYGGSTGFGREYRDRLRDQWGIVDVEDCVNAALYLVRRGDVDASRLAIRGGSAGGYTTLCVLTFRDEFAAGASYYGVADAGALAKETHKFESRYLDNLIGPWPEAEARYVERSPIFHLDQLTTPVILFQGLEDRIVPPDQAEMMAAALRASGVPFSHLTFEGEQHGFRRAETIVRTIETELAFYGRVLGFAPADAIAPFEIENAGSL